MAPTVLLKILEPLEGQHAETAIHRTFLPLTSLLSAQRLQGLLTSITSCLVFYLSAFVVRLRVLRGKKELFRAMGGTKYSHSWS